MAHKGPTSVLSSDPVRATHELIGILGALGGIIDEESNTLASGNSIGFVALQEVKERAADTYQKAAAEFRQRLEEFRKVDKTLIARLEITQRDFAERARTNLEILDRNRGSSVRIPAQMTAMDTGATA